MPSSSQHAKSDSVFFLLIDALKCYIDLLCSFIWLSLLCETIPYVYRGKACHKYWPRNICRQLRDSFYARFYVSCKQIRSVNSSYLQKLLTKASNWCRAIVLISYVLHTVLFSPSYILTVRSRHWNENKTRLWWHGLRKKSAFIRDSEMRNYVRCIP